MSNDDLRRKQEEALKRQREVQERQKREEELRRIRESEERQKQKDDSDRRGRPIDVRPGKDE